MDYSNASLLLKRPVTVKAIVTAQWKEEVTQQLQKQVAQLDKQMQQLEMQGKRTIEEITKQAGATNPQVQKQTENIQGQVNQKKAEMLEKKNQFLQQLQQIQLLELNQEVVQAQMESFFRLEPGDNLVKKLNVEIVLRDGVVEEIRGDV
ncbi:MAG TPA: YlqD family protein [Coleofasciculaceae cyanobacterium]|jgi:DNA anti-recombination protein RmuC